MGDPDDTSLHQRILEYYHRHGEYGPLLEASDTPSGPDEPWIDDIRFISPFPCATEDQLRRTEEAMGFPFPPLLRSLYRHVGNGGFGPGAGLVGAFPTDSEIENDPHYLAYLDDPYNSDYPDYKASVLEQCLRPFAVDDLTLIDIEDYEDEHGELKNMPTDVWPKHFIYLCNGEYCDHWFLHAKTERVYYCIEGHLSNEADSLEEWLERWLQEANAKLTVVHSYIIDSYLIE